MRGSFLPMLILVQIDLQSSPPLIPSIHSNIQYVFSDEVRVYIYGALARLPPTLPANPLLYVRPVPSNLSQFSVALKMNLSPSQHNSVRQGRLESHLSQSQSHFARLWKGSPCYVAFFTSHSQTDSTRQIKS